MNYKLYKKSRNLSWDILIRERVCELPVSVSKLCKSMGIEIKYADSNSKSDGWCQITRNQPIIFINGNCSVQRQRFTAAHELGHILLGHVGKYELVNREPSPNDNPIEHAANVFASRLLAPACVLWGLHIKNAEQIEQLCNISKTSAEFRMKRLNELYEREQEFLARKGKSCFLSSPLEKQVFVQFQPFIKEKSNFI